VEGSRVEMAKKTNDERDADHAREIAVQEEIMATRTADEWEEFLQARHVPAALSVSELGENLVVVLAKRGRRRVDALVRHGRT
jgi:hypothetical protein